MRCVDVALLLLAICCRGLAFMMPLNSYPGLQKEVAPGLKESNMEVIIPTLIHLEKSSTLYANDSHYRNKRNTHRIFTTRTSYELKAFGENILLNLTTDVNFIAPQFIVQHGNISYLRDPLAQGGGVKECFYTGSVNGETRSHSTINLCKGMTGRIYFSKGDYLIEPHPEDTHIDAVNEKRHIIYKRTADEHSEDSCGLKENYKHGKRKPTTNVNLLNTDKYINKIPHTQRTVLRNRTASIVHSRHKRSYSWERYVEVMVAADSKMVAYHGSRLEQYLLTLMAVVTSIYKDASIGNNINIVIVKLVVIEKENDGPKISNNAASSLREFCKWQNGQNSDDDRHPYHHDTAILLTKNDICRSASKCDTLGLAELGTMCDPLKSCSIIEDNGLSAAFTIAHELGHVFSIPHDDNKNCQTMSDGKAGFHVMSPTLDYNTDPWTWSKCSRFYMTQFLDGVDGNCLLDKPGVDKYKNKIAKAMQHLPGESYSAGQQCELVFGKGSDVCSYMPVCKRLWCTSPYGLANGCRTQHMPWADGTKCASNKWCFDGECVFKSRQNKPVNGGWNRWNGWGDCSRTCGGGVMASVRHCDRPSPQYGGRYCVGRRVRYRSCNTQDCPSGTQEFREEQCSEFDGKHFNINGLTPATRWVPKYSGIASRDQCKLYCRVSGSSSFYRLAHKVKDGTNCDLDTTDLCVNGVCRKAGCDNRLGSRTKTDKCGVCGGDDSSCKTITDTYSKRVRYGYNYVVTIPSGALGIEITQHGHQGRKDDDNYLALGTSKGLDARTNGPRDMEYILNGKFIVSMFPVERMHKGVKIEYSGSDNVVEKINVTSKLKDDLYVMVLSVGNLNPPDIRYSYVVSTGKPTSSNTAVQPKSRYDIGDFDDEERNSDSRKSQPKHRPQPTIRYYWDREIGSWSSCSKECQGMREKRLLCVNEQNQRPVSNSFCSGLEKLTPVRDRCNTDCRVSWHTIPDRRAVCSVRCGVGVIKQRVLCVKRSRTRAHPVEDKHCEQTKPKSEVPCQGQCAPGKWSYTSWTQCSATCGGGIQKRQGICLDEDHNKLPDTECKEDKITEERCNAIPCPSWQSTSWSSCSVTCGVGSIQRSVSCVIGDKPVPERLCSVSEKPASERACTMSDCPFWYHGVWSQCSVSCGVGVQMRAVRCRSVSGDLLRDTSCNGTVKPSLYQNCQMPVCTTTVPPTTTIITTTTTTPPPTTTTTAATTTTPVPFVPPRLPVVSRRITQWRTGSWTSCSTTCGEGFKARYVSCRNHLGEPATDQHCSHTPKPPSREICLEAYCGKWRLGDWGQCSRSCGDGEEIRYVACIMLDQQLVDEKHCDVASMPVAKRKCNSRECISIKDYDIARIDSNNVVGTSHWRVGPWGQCTRTCGKGWQRRQVVCQDENGVSDSCDSDGKPEEIQQCDTGECPTWNYGDWAQCSTTCGAGQQSRAVVCQRPFGNVLSDDHCNIIARPPDRQQCHNQECPRRGQWQPGAWSSCSVSCGHGTRNREVLCKDDNGDVLDETLCEEEKPRNVRGCRLERCPKWVTSSWEKCSKSCGEGVRDRQIHCIQNGTIVNQNKCPKDRPESREICIEKSCPRGRWKPGGWSKCSVTCGRGVQMRPITCINNSTGETISPDLCNKDLRMKDKRLCKLPPCPYMWTTGNWSECSKSCDSGQQARSVICQRVTKEGWIMPGGVNRGCKLSEKPDSVQRCNMGKCDGGYFWRTGEWSQCSTDCGWGKTRRVISCVNKEGKRRAKRRCDSKLKPQRIKPCYISHCYPKTCLELKQKNGIRLDGDYRMLIERRLIKIYCKDMKKRHPKEYVSLPSGNELNFSEIYNKRLLDSNSCPYEGTRNPDCACAQRNYPRAGYTSFSKIRVNITSLAIITNDFTFSSSTGSRRIPYATGGDCYSAIECPQGGFHIDLSGTGFQVSKKSGWYSHGHNAVQKIQRLQGGVMVRAKCGGYCGMCMPHMSTGLSLQLVDL